MTDQPKKRGRGRPTTEVMELRGQMALLERIINVLTRHMVQVTSDMHHGLHGGKRWVSCLCDSCARTKHLVTRVAERTGSEDLARLVN